MVIRCPAVTTLPVPVVSTRRFVAVVENGACTLTTGLAPGLPVTSTAPRSVVILVDVLPSVPAALEQPATTAAATRTAPMRRMAKREDTVDLRRGDKTTATITRVAVRPDIPPGGVTQSVRQAGPSAWSDARLPDP